MNTPELIETTLLRGQVKLLQPKVGFHASTDSVMLAAAIPVKDKQNLLDIGCGVGSVGLCVTSRNKSIHLTGIDIQKDIIDIAHQNAALNNIPAAFFAGDISKEKIIEDNYFHEVAMNPPYYEAGTHTPSPEKIKATSHGESTATLEDWIKYAHRKLKQGGHLTLIHRADRLDDILRILTAKRWFGSVIVYPLFSYAGEDAKRVIVRARKERYAPLVMKPGMILHKENGKYTEDAAAVLDGAAVLI